jgi:hypothetical protein
MAAVDLRPMTLGEVLDRTFKLYKSEFWLFAGIMSLPFLFLFFVNVGIGWLSTSEVASIRAGNLPSTSAGQILAAGLGAGLFVLLLTFVLTGIGQAATIFAVSEIYLGRQATIRGAFERVRGHLLPVLGTIFLVGLAVGLGFILLIVPGVILMCRTGVAVPAAALEDLTPGVAFSRSMDLTKGFALQMFVILLLAIVLAIGVSMVFTLPFTLLATMPTPHVLPFGLLILQYVGAFIGQVLVAPVQVIAFSLMYYNLRVRKEGFDLEHLMGSLGTSSLPPVPTPDNALPS